MPLVERARLGAASRIAPASPTPGLHREEREVVDDEDGVRRRRAPDPDPRDAQVLVQAEDEARC
jgi:hypothetical protein